MSPAHVFEPTYEAIKRRLTTGEWASGTRIEAAPLADDLGVSVTPVRDSLFRLNGERMVDFAAGEGFHVHRLTETEFRDLLELHLILLLAALATAPNGPAASVATDQPYPDRIADLFLAIAARSSNGEIVACIAAIGDRLQLSRHFDATILADVEAEYRMIEAAVADAEPQAKMRNLLLRYHERRAHEAATYARTLAGHPGRQPKAPNGAG
jgi:DNA-binding FadR family transcriptional regulator